MAQVAINLPALILNLLKVGSFWFIWMAPVMLAGYVLMKRRQMVSTHFANEPVS